METVQAEKNSLDLLRNSLADSQNVFGSAMEDLESEMHDKALKYEETIAKLEQERHDLHDRATHAEKQQNLVRSLLCFHCKILFFVVRCGGRADESFFGRSIKESRRSERRKEIFTRKGFRFSHGKIAKSIDS